MKKKECSDCEEEYPATSEFFHRNKSARDGLTYICKECGRERARRWHRRERAAKEGTLQECEVCKLKKPPTTKHFDKCGKSGRELQTVCKACVEKVNKDRYTARRAEMRTLQKVEEELRLQGAVFIKEMKIYKNGEYEVERAKYKDRKNKIRGRLIQQTERFITLESKGGLVESFLKADLETGDHTIKKVS